MSVDAFTYELGTQQGRIQPTGVQPAEGNWALVLGSEREGAIWSLNVGDYIEWTQSADFAPGTKLFRVTAATFRGPAEVTVGARWRFSLIINGTERAGYYLEAGRTVGKVTLAANVAGLGAGPHTVTLRLEVTS